MFITLYQLEQKPVAFKVELPAGEIDFDTTVTQINLLKAEGTAQLLSHSLAEIRLVGKIDVAMTSMCARCLESTVFSVQKPFDLVYVPAVDTVAGETEVDQAGIEVGYYQGIGIELNDVLREVVLLELPMQLTCGEDCKGICPVCGQNRNQLDCHCAVKAEDDRWQGLKNLRSTAGVNH